MNYYIVQTIVIYIIVYKFETPNNYILVCIYYQKHCPIEAVI